MNKENVISLEEARLPKASPFKDIERNIQFKAMCADIETEASIIKSLQVAYAALKVEKAKFLMAMINPIFFQQCLESLEGAKLTIQNYWAFGDGYFFYRNTLAVKIGKYSQDILFQDELTEPQLLQIAIRLQDSCKWADRILEGEGVK